MKELKHASEYIKAYEPTEIEIAGFNEVVTYIEAKYEKVLRSLDVVIHKDSFLFVLKNLRDKGFYVEEIDKGFYANYEKKVIIRIKW